jgi:hypothetical protein
MDRGTPPDSGECRAVDILAFFPSFSFLWKKEESINEN